MRGLTFRMATIASEPSAKMTLAVPSVGGPKSSAHSHRSVNTTTGAPLFSFCTDSKSPPSRATISRVLNHVTKCRPSCDMRVG